MPAGTVSRGITMAVLLAMTTVLLFPAPTPWSGLVAVPLIVFFVTGLKPPRKWGGWVAVTMVPYFCIALGEVVADPTGRIVSGLLAGGATIVFFAALDSMRRSGISLRS